MEPKLNMMGFVLSFVFLIGMGLAIAQFDNFLVQFILTSIAAVGYWIIISLTEDLMRENE